MENRKIKILAIDDNPDNLITIKALIKEAFPNVSILSALNGKKGIEIASSDDPDVILLDIVMSEMDGFEVCEKLKSGEKTSEIPVIFITAIKGDKDSRIRALEVGAEAFLAKPIDESELAAQIRAMLKIKTAVLEKRNENLRLAELVEERTREINANYIASVNLFEDLEKENARRKQTEKALSESQERYRTLIENASEAIYVIQSGNIVFANNACSQIAGVPASELLGKSMSDFVDKDQRERVLNQHIDLSEGKVQTNSGIYSIIKPGGDRIWLSINSVRITWNDNPASLNFATDITERKQAEDALKESEEKFREMTDFLPQIVFETDEINNVTYLNKKAYEITGYTESDLLKGTAQHGFVIPEDYERLFKNFRIKLAGEITDDREYTLLCKDGSTVPVLIYSNAIIKNGKASGIRGVVVDISQQKQAEKQIRESEEKYRLLFANNPQPMWIYDLETLAFMEVNQSAITHYGYSREEFLSMTIKDIRPAEDIPNLLKNVDNIRHEITNPISVWRHLKKNGEIIFVELTSVAVISNGRKARHILINDITDRKLAEKELNEQKHFFEQMFMQSSVSTQILNREGWCERINPKLTRIFGVEPENIEGGKYNIFKDDSIIQNGIVPKLEKVFKDGQSVDWEVFFDIGIAADSQNIDVHEKKKAWFSNWAYPIFEQNGDISHVIIQHNDITERKQAEDALKQSEEKFREMANLLPQIVFEIDLNGVMTYVNDQSFAVLGYKNTELVGQKSVMVHIPEERDRVVDLLQRRPSWNEIVDREFTMLRKDGTVFTALIYTNGILKDNNLVGLRGIIVDITERKLAEEKLQVNELFLKETQKIARLGSYTFNFIDNNWTSSEVLNEISGIPDDFDKSFESWESFIHPDWQKIVSDYFEQEVIAKKSKFDKIYQIIRQTDQTPLWVHDIAELQFDKDNQLIGMIGSVQDITDIKMAEEALQKSEMFLRTFIENSPFEIWARDVNNIGIIENKKMIDRFGSILGKTSEEFSAKDPKIVELWNKNSKRVYAGETVDEVVEYESDNTSLFFHQIIFPIKNKEEIIGIAGFNIDITERKRIESELMETQSLYLSFIEQLPNAVFRKDLQGRYVLVNSHFCELKGVSKEEFMGATATEIAAKEILVHADNERSVKYAQSGEDVHKQILKTGKSFESEEEYPTPDGKVIYLHVLKMPVIDSNGAIIGSQGIMFDITESKLIELALNESEEQLKKFASHLQNVREEEKIALAREIHDDLGQILVALKIDMGLLKQKVIKSNVFAGSKDILTKFDNMVTLIDDTIKTARRIMNGLRPEQIELLGFVEATKTYLLDFEERHHISCQFNHAILELEMSTPQAVALFRIVQEALNNIVKHAKATVIIINLTNPAGKLMLEIIDNGVGFDMNKIGRQDSYGLIGMKERVFLLEGELNITSKIGEGTTVKVEIPYGNNRKSLK